MIVKPHDFIVLKYTTISINNARFYGYHGIHDYEKKYGSEFEVDIEMECDLIDLKDSDDLNKTVDYVSVYSLVKDIFSSFKFSLLETLAKRICDEILSKYLKVKSVKVNIRKRGSSLGKVDSVEIVNFEKRI